jgi:F0F1-type ATP synthase membrane subunit b/b'
MRIKRNLIKNTAFMIVLGIFLLAGNMARADKPQLNVSPERHSNIAAAQQLIQDAWEKISAAQKDNRYDMQGHAKKAKELLEQANIELKLAAEAANRNMGK